MYDVYSWDCEFEAWEKIGVIDTKISCDISEYITGACPHIDLRIVEQGVSIEPVVIETD